jgi:hypothetical protein
MEDVLPCTDSGRPTTLSSGGRSYRIRVEGRIENGWSSRLGGLRILPEFIPHRTPAGSTILEGTLSDRAALLGVLNTLHDLNLTLVSVETIAEDTDAGNNTGMEDDS